VTTSEPKEFYGHDIVLVGASAGGVEAVIRLVSGLPCDLPAAVFVVLHMAPHVPSVLPQILARNTPLLVKEAGEREAIKRGTVYVAAPNLHLVVDVDVVRVIDGPKEDFHRPSIDTLFRSAALAYGPRCVGVVLTGARHDGTVGMAAIKSQGGITVVQDPSEALFPSMPLSVLQNVEVDYLASLELIPQLIINLAAQPASQERLFAVSNELHKTKVG
jgi:two-component system chemotaxis response regulator CheB